MRTRSPALASAAMNARMKSAGRSFRVIRTSTNRFGGGTRMRTIWFPRVGMERYKHSPRVWASDWFFTGGGRSSRPDGQSRLMTVVDMEPKPGGRLALRVLQIGAIAVILAVTTFHAFELDRFFAP